MFQPAQTVVAAFVGDEAVLWSQSDGVYYGLDEVGVRVWRLGGEGMTIGGIHERLLAEYDVDASTLWTDLARLTSELHSLGLVVIALAAPDDAASVSS